MLEDQKPMDEDGSFSVSAQGNAEEATLDGSLKVSKGKRKSKASTKPLECWTLNCGGLGGVWRFLNMMNGIKWIDRPKLIQLQETSCDGEQWKSIERFLKKLGFRGYHTMGTMDSKPVRGAWKRGVITAVSDTLKSEWIGEHSWKNGQFHALKINGILCLNSYSRPSEADILAHLGSLQSFLTRSGVGRSLAFRGRLE